MSTPSPHRDGQTADAPCVPPKAAFTPPELPLSWLNPRPNQDTPARLCSRPCSPALIPGHPIQGRMLQAQYRLPLPLCIVGLLVHIHNSFSRAINIALAPCWRTSQHLNQRDGAKVCFLLPSGAELTPEGSPVGFVQVPLLSPFPSAPAQM